MSVEEDLLKRSDRVAAYPGTGHEPWKPEIVEAIYGLLYRDDLGVDRLVEDLQKMERREGPIVYVELLYLLCHMRFEPVYSPEYVSF